MTAERIDQYNSEMFSSQTPWHPHLTNLTPRQEFIYRIMRGQTPKLDDLTADEALISTVFWEKDIVVLKEARELIQKMLIDISIAVQEQSLSETDSFHMEMIVGDLLSHYPYTGPQDHDLVSAPTRINGRWKTIQYHVEELLLTSKNMGSPIVAYGLTAADGPPLLLFKGTTYPTDKGFGLSLLTDLNPFASVGAYVYRSGESKLASWFQKHTNTHQKAIVYGKSLGGAHAWRTALKFPEYIGQVMAYGAPGLFFWDLKRLKQLHKQDQLPTINMFIQTNDPVPCVDIMASEGIYYYEVGIDQPRHHVFAHADIYSTHEQSTIRKIDPKKYPRRITRIAMTVLRAIASVTIFPIASLGFILWISAENSAKFLHRLLFAHKMAKQQEKAKEDSQQV